MAPFDPLLDLELREKKKRSLLSSLGRTIRFLTLYFTTTAIVFVVLISILNFSAYSKRLEHWVNPDALLQAKAEFENILASTSVEVHASEGNAESKSESLEAVTEKLESSNPEMIYGRTYQTTQLLSHIDEQRKLANFQVTPYENRIIIPRINKNIPLVEVSLHGETNFETMHETFMEELKKWVVRYPGTANPWEKGNAFIFGHSSNYPWVKSNYNDVFALLDQLQNGDEIIVYSYQKKYTYKVVDRAVVTPGDVAALEARDPEKKELTLMTCWPVGTTLERILIFAELVE